MNDESNILEKLNFNTLLKPKDRLKQFMEALNEYGGCDNKANEGCMDVSASMQAALKLVKDYGYSLRDKCSKNETFLGLLTRKFNCCHRQRNPTEYREELAEAIEESGISLESSAPKASTVPKLFYDRKTHNFWYPENSGVYQSLSASAAVDKLETCGLSSERLPDGTSEISRHLVGIRDNNGIDAVLSLAGYAPGLYTVKGKKILVPYGCSLIQPVEKTHDDTQNYRHVYAIIRGLFSDDTAFSVFLLHLRECWLSLRAGVRSGGIACAIVGPPDCGKTLLLEKIIVPMLGGRKANAYAFLGGGSNFNDELVGSEIHTIDDGSPFDTLDARKKFGNALKSHVAGGEFWCHAKGLSAFTLPTYRRLFILCNREDLALMPELDDSLLDKLHIFSVQKFDMPADCLPLPARHDQAACDAFTAKLAEELPYFLFGLEQFEAPADLVSRRFGVVAYQSEEISRELDELSEYHQRHAVIQQSIFSFSDPERHGGSSAEIEVNQLYEMLMNGDHKDRAIRLFRNARSLGSCLGHLSKKEDFRGTYQRKKSNGDCLWTIQNVLHEVK